MNRCIFAVLRALVIVVFSAGVVFSGPINAYFAPDGGFSPKNKNRTITMSDGTKVRATLANGLTKMIGETEARGQIKICMYAMGDMPTVDALIRAARDRHIKVKLILDACAEWTAEIREQIVERVKNARAECKKKKQEFDFQIKFITRPRMEDRGRTRELKDGTIIYGTMHEKFGVFYSPGANIPYNCFAGSSNVSMGSDQIFAENRIFFYDRPAVARQFQEEFARLWNEYGSCMGGRCQSEMFVAAYPMSGDVRVIFNGEPITEDTYNRIDEELEKLIRQVNWKKGSLDVAMFSLTHRNLADAIVRCASKKKSAKFRILLDQRNIVQTETNVGVLGQWFERQAEKKGLKNLEVRYKWRSNAYGWDEENGIAALLHTRNPLLHHKLLIVNKDLMATGSYNWSASAEERNLENIMIFKRAYKMHGKGIDGFLAEFDAIWDSLKPEGIVKKPVGMAPQSITGPRGRELRKRILQLVGNEVNWKIVQALDRGKFLTSRELAKIAGISGKKLTARLDALADATLISKSVRKGVEGYLQAD